MGITDNIVDLPSGFVPGHTSKSVPNFKRCVLEQGIGLELRDISDSFYLAFGGFVSCLQDAFYLPSSNSIHLLFVARIYRCVWQKW